MFIAIPKKDSEMAREEVRLKLKAVGFDPQAIDRFLQDFYRAPDKTICRP